MKALSLTQPWATLVAIGAKAIETRSWPTRYRGPIAIHAAKGFPADIQALCTRPVFQRALTEAGYRISRSVINDKLRHDLPLGAVICMATLVDCWPITTENLATHFSTPAISPLEEAFGNYQPDRWAWILRDVRRFPEPIAAKGALGLWEWQPPTDGLPALAIDHERSG